MEGKAFACAVNCMDGRTQEPVNAYLKKRFDVPYVDEITEPGPIKIIAEKSEPCLANIKLRCDISVLKHKAVGLAAVSHYDCAGNPVDKDAQLKQLEASVAQLREWYPDLPILGLWVDENWTVSEVITDMPEQA